MCGGVRSDAGLVEQLWCEFAGERFDLACELAFLGGQLQDAAGDRAEREQAAAQFWIAATVGSCCCEALQQPRACQRPQLAAQRLRRRDQQVAQLTESGPLGVDCSLACSDQAPAAPGVRRRRVGSLAAVGRARCGRHGPRRARRSCRPSGAPVAAGRPRAPAHRAPVRKRVRPAPNEPVPSTANARRAGACSSASFNACA